MNIDEFKKALAKQNGPKELYIGNVVIPMEMIGDISPNYEGGTTETETQGGTLRRPSGRADTSEVTATLYLAGPESVKAVYSALYNAPTSGSGQNVGNIVWGAGACVSDAETVPLHIHPVCEDNDDFDIHVFAVTLPDSFNPTFAANGDDATLQLTFQMNRTDEGYFRFGPGLLNSKGKYDPETGTVTPIAPTPSA